MSARSASSNWSGSAISLAFTRNLRSSSSARDHLHPHVGAQQRLFELDPGVGGDAAASVRIPTERAGEGGTGLRHPRPDGGPHTGRWRCRLDRCGPARGGARGRGRARRTCRAGRCRTLAAVPDDDADAEHQHGDDGDEIQQLHEGVTLPARDQLSEPAAIARPRHPAVTGERQALVDDPLDDHLRRTAGLHGHAEQAVAGLHRALLVADDQQLRLAGGTRRAGRGSGAG